MKDFKDFLKETLFANFNELEPFHQIHQTFPLPKNYTIQYIMWIEITWGTTKRIKSIPQFVLARLKSHEEQDGAYNFARLKDE